MIIQCHPRLVARLRRFSLISSVVVAVGGCLVLAGWRMDIVWLKSIFPGWASMKPNTALAFIFAGISLGLLRAEQPAPVARRMGRACAVVVMGIGLLAQAEYLFGFHVGIEQLLLRPMANAPVTTAAFRTPPNDLAGLILLGTALLLLNVETGRRFRPAQMLSMMAVLIGLAVLLGYIFGAQPLEGMGPYRMAFHTAVGLLILSAGILGARSDRGMMRVFTSDSAGGVMARRLMPAAVLIPAGLGLLRVWAFRRGFLENLEIGMALTMVATMFVFAVIIWVNARWLYRTDADRLKAEIELRKSVDTISDLYNNAPCGYHSLAADGSILRVNDTELAWLGYQREELVGRKKFSDLLTPAGLKLFHTSFPAFKERGWVHDLEMEMVRKDGTVLPVLINATALQDAKGNFLMSRSTVVDMTERRRESRRLAIEYSVTRILAEATSLTEAVPKILQSVCESLEWDAGALWTLDRPVGVMRCVEFWHRADKDVQVFEEATRQRTYSAGAGLPGRVWSRGEPAWIQDVVQDVNFPRSVPASQVGLHGAFGFPIRLGAEILGVIEFFSREIRQPDEDLLRSFDAIGAQIGQFIERKQVESALVQERDLIKTLMDNIPDLIYFKDRQSRFFRVNRAWAERIKVADFSQAIGKTDFDFFTAEHAQQAFADEQRIMETGEPIVGVEEKETWPDGSVTWVSTTKECLRDRQGNIIGTFGISRDITKHKHAELALEQERFLLHSLMENLPDLIYFKDSHGRFLRNNRAHLERLGLSDPAQVLGKSDLDFFTEEFARQTQADEQQIIRTGEALTKEEELSHADGRVNWALITKMPLRDTEGQIVGTFGISRDITERKLAEKQLARYAAELRQKNEQVEEELKMARELQQALLPQQFPILPPHSPPKESALQFSSFYHPSGNVSGDYFNIFPISDTAAGIFICDVMGHDVRAALVTAMMRAFVQDLAPLAGDPGGLLTEINRGLAGILRQTGTIMYATAAYLMVDVARGRLLYANAGHPHPLHLHGESGRVSTLQRTGCVGPALGLFDDAVYQTCEDSIAAGDFLLLFTDGLFEIEGRDQQQYSHEQLQAAVQKHGRRKPADLLAAVLAEVKEFSANKEFTDDVCLVGAEIKRLFNHQ